MKTENQIEKSYNKLLNDVATNDYYKVDLTNRVNCYTCSNCHHITKTKDIDAGVTPAFFSCEECGGSATSSFYRDIAPNKRPTFEWYRPTLQQVFKMSDGILEHILKGGLDYRKIK